MDLADQIDDYICHFEGVGDLTADMLAMFIFVWAVLALFLVWLCKFLYNKYVLKNTINNKTETTTSLSGSLGANKLDIGEKRQLSEPREIISSKDVKDLGSKPLGGKSGFRGRPGSGGGGGYVAPTPPIRKRLTTRMSPGPELKSKSRSVAPPSNVVGPETTSVTWTSQVFRWLYSDLVIVNDLLNVWMQALNNSTSKVAEDHGVAVEVVRVLPDSPAPSLQNLFCNSDESNPSEMVITCDCDATPVLQIRAVRQKSGKMETHHYKVTVSRFRARLSAPMNYNTLKGEMKVEGYPDIRIVLNSVGAVKPIDQDEQHLQDVISEILTSALRDTTYPIDFSMYGTCPRPMDLRQLDNSVMFPPFNYDPLAMREETMYNMNRYNLQNRAFGTPPPGMTFAKRLLVKVVKGEGITKATDPYCVVEMDEPPQKNQTGARQGTNPRWDEHFLFVLSDQSAEILFEVYDRPANTNDPPKFLGLGLVGIDELAVGPESSQILTLQPRPYETEVVNGAIFVEFVFVEGADVPINPRAYKLKEALKINTPITNEHQNNESGLADAAVKALKDGSLGTNGQPSKSTLIIHSVQRVELNKDGLIVLSDNNDETDCQQDISVTDVTASPTDSLPPDSSELGQTSVDIHDENNKDVSGNAVANGNVEMDSFGRPGAQSSPHPSSQVNGNGLPISNSGTNLSQGQGNTTTTTDDEQGRNRKKRDFFGTLKRRLGRSKTRSKSIDRDMIPNDAENVNGSTRSISADRTGGSRGGGGGAGSRGGTLSNSASPGPRLIVPTLDQSRRSSLSESSAISGFSSASTKTFLHEASTLVLETIENGIKRHFLVPFEIAQRPRWRRKGTKLHVYNEHTFVAKHLSGNGLVCAVCTKSIPRRPGKQGYECRDCQLICHKQCHVRVPQLCPNPTIVSLELSKLSVAIADNIIRKV